MQSPPRRSRQSRTSRSKALVLTPRDLAIFRLLGGYRFLPSTFIHRFVGGKSVTRFTERLGDLFHEGYLDRPEPQWHLADARSQPTVHEIDAGARRVIATMSTNGDDTRTYLGPCAQRQYLHTLLICEAVASMELEARAVSCVRFISWGEIVARAPEAVRSSSKPFAFPVPGSSGVIIPDAIFGLEYSHQGRRTFRFFALEVDRATMPVSRAHGGEQTSFAMKLEAYSRIIAGRSHKSHLGIPNLIVLTLSTGEAHLQRMVAIFEDEVDAGRALLFKTLPREAQFRGLKRPLEKLLSEPWLRPRQEPVSLLAF